MKHSKFVGLIVLSLGAMLVYGAAFPRICRETIRGDGTIIVGERRQRAVLHAFGAEQDGIAAGLLDYRDRSNGIRLRSRNLTGYEVVDAETRTLTFDLGDDATAVVTLRDLGRRGRDDFFEIASGDYVNSGNLRTGQIRLRLKSPRCDDVVVEQ